MYTSVQEIIDEQQPKKFSFDLSKTCIKISFPLSTSFAASSPHGPADVLSRSREQHMRLSTGVLPSHHPPPVLTALFSAAVQAYPAAVLPDTESVTSAAAVTHLFLAGQFHSAPNFSGSYSSEMPKSNTRNIHWPQLSFSLHSCYSRYLAQVNLLKN